MNNTCCAGTPCGTCCGACDNGPEAPTPPTTSTSSSGNTYEPRSDSSIGSPHTAFRSRTHGKATSTNGPPATPPHCGGKPGTSCDGPRSRNSPPSTRQPSDGTVPPASSTPRPDGDQARRLLHDDTIKPEDR